MAATSRRGKSGIKSVIITTKLLHTRNNSNLVRARRGHCAYGLKHNCTKKTAVVTQTRIISDYSLKGEVDRARQLFDQMGHKDSVSWNIMINCYVKNNRIGDARELFDRMPEKTSVSWNSMIMAYANQRKTNIAFKLFVVMPDKDVVSWTAIVTALSQDSKIKDAWDLFKQMPEPNSISWSSIISGFQQNGFPAQTLEAFREMLSIGVQPTSHSLTSALAASADLAMLSVSEQVYAQLLRRGFDRNLHIGNSAISMFIKSGSFVNARCIFVNLPQPDLVSWNSMIIGFGQHGYGVEAVITFHQMQKAQIFPDHISFLGLLHGCSHCGFVEEGYKYFCSMEMDYGIPPGPEHYASIIDLFARAGMLKEAYENIMQMPYEITLVFWRTLLNGCRIWGDLELGRYAVERILELDPYNSSARLMVIDIFASTGRWKEVMDMRRQIRELEAKKALSSSWIEIKGRNHFFTTRDENHSESDYIYLILQLLTCDIAVCQNWMCGYQRAAKC